MRYADSSAEKCSATTLCSHCFFLQDMEEFVQSSEDDGIVVFSLGSMINNMTREKGNMMATALAQIPQKVGPFKTIARKRLPLVHFLVCIICCTASVNMHIKKISANSKQLNLPLTLVCCFDDLMLELWREKVTYLDFKIYIFL